MSTDIFKAANAINGAGIREDTAQILTLAVENGVANPELPFFSVTAENYFYAAGKALKANSYVAARELLAEMDPALLTPTINASIKGLDALYQWKSPIPDIRKQAVNIFGSQFNAPYVRALVDGHLQGDTLAIAASQAVICGLRPSIGSTNNSTSALYFSNLATNITRFYYSIGLVQQDVNTGNSTSKSGFLSQQASKLSRYAVPKLQQVAVGAIQTGIVRALSGPPITDVFVAGSTSATNAFNKVGAVLTKTAEATTTFKANAEITREILKEKHDLMDNTGNVCANMDSPNLHENKALRARKLRAEDGYEMVRAMDRSAENNIALLRARNLSRYLSDSDAARYGIEKGDGIENGDINGNLLYNNESGGESYDAKQLEAINDGILLKTAISKLARLTSDRTDAAAMQYEETLKQYSSMMSGAQSSYNYVKSLHLENKP